MTLAAITCIIMLDAAIALPSQKLEGVHQESIIRKRRVQTTPVEQVVLDDVGNAHTVGEPAPGAPHGNSAQMHATKDEIGQVHIDTAKKLFRPRTNSKHSALVESLLELDDSGKNSMLDLPPDVRTSRVGKNPEEIVSSGIASDAFTKDDGANSSDVWSLEESDVWTREAAADKKAGSTEAVKSFASDAVDLFRKGANKLFRSQDEESDKDQRLEYMFYLALSCFLFAILFIAPATMKMSNSLAGQCLHEGAEIYEERGIAYKSCEKCGHRWMMLNNQWVQLKGTK
jgi:hypothetical protein